jgi:hypothetical protein
MKKPYLLKRTYTIINTSFFSLEETGLSLGHFNYLCDYLIKYKALYKGNQLRHAQQE